MVFKSKLMSGVERLEKYGWRVAEVIEEAVPSISDCVYSRQAKLVKGDIEIWVGEHVFMVGKRHVVRYTLLTSDDLYLYYADTMCDIIDEILYLYGYE